MPVYAPDFQLESILSHYIHVPLSKDLITVCSFLNFSFYVDPPLIILIMQCNMIMTSFCIIPYYWFILHVCLVHTVIAHFHLFILHLLHKYTSLLRRLSFGSSRRLRDKPKESLRRRLHTYKIKIIKMRFNNVRPKCPSTWCQLYGNPIITTDTLFQINGQHWVLKSLCVTVHISCKQALVYHFSAII